jgi:SAM-dependent methyltransferase
VLGTGSGPIGPEGLSLGRDAGRRPNIGRIYDYYLGGKDNLAVDREIAARVAQAQPLVVAGVRANRAFVRRAVAFLAGSGIDQLVDLGSGLPTADNVHAVASRINPDARVAYVDNDPVVLVHARALLAGSPRTIVVEGDIREPEAILEARELREHIDFTRPVGVVMAAILHFVAEDPARIVAAFREVMAPGSALVITHVVDGGDSVVNAATRKAAQIYSETTAPFMVRTRKQVATWFGGLTLAPPGLVDADSWRRTGNGRTTAPIVAGVGLLDRSGTCAEFPPVGGQVASTAFGPHDPGGSDQRDPVDRRLRGRLHTPERPALLLQRTGPGQHPAPGLGR